MKKEFKHNRKILYKIIGILLPAMLAAVLAAGCGPYETIRFRPHGDPDFIIPDSVQDGVDGAEIAEDKDRFDSDPWILPAQCDNVLTPKVDTFQQEPVGVVDILWVLDCSGYMAEEQKKLAVGFERFYDRAREREGDFQLAVISCDSPVFLGSVTPEKNTVLVNLQSNPNYMPRDELLNTFHRRVDLGTQQCSSIELCLQTSYEALLGSAQAPQFNPPEFFRPGGDLDVIYVSDEDDQSEESVNEYARAIGRLLDTDERLHAYAMVGPLPDGCMSDADQALPGDRYHEFASLTGGLARSICEPTFEPIYEDLAADLFPRYSHFTLAFKAVLQVRGRSDTEGDYRFEESENVVIFNEDSIPRPSAVIEISCETLCG